MNLKTRFANGSLRVILAVVAAIGWTHGRTASGATESVNYAQPDYSQPDYNANPCSLRDLASTRPLRRTLRQWLGLSG